MADALKIDLRLGAQRHTQQRLPGNLAQLGAVGPTLLSGPPAPAQGTQPVIVAGNILSGPKQQTMGKAQKPVVQYLQEGKGPQGQDAHVFGKGHTPPDTARFTDATLTDPRQFRFSVSLPAHVKYVPMQAYTEVLMAWVEKDLGRPLDWIAAVHHDTKHPHSHVVLRGKDLEEKDLYITTHYLSHGLRQRATQVALWLVGEEKLLGRAPEGTQERTQEPRGHSRRRAAVLGKEPEQQRGQEMGL